MLIEDLTALAQELNLNYDSENTVAYGVYKGYGLTAKAVPDKDCYIVTIWARKGALTSVLPEQWMAGYLQNPENSFIKSHAVHPHSVAAVLKAEQDSNINYRHLHGYIYDLVNYYSSNYFSDACNMCGSAISLDFIQKSNGVYTRLCRMCLEKEKDNMESQAAKKAIAEKLSTRNGAILPQDSQDNADEFQKRNVPPIPVAMPAQDAAGNIPGDNPLPVQTGFGAPSQGDFGVNTAPQDGFNAPQSGFNATQDGYNAPPQGGFNATPQGGFNATPQGGFNATPQGGFNATPQGGFNATPQGGFDATPQGGFNATPQGGFNATPQGGYNNPQGGFPQPGNPYAAYAAQPVNTVTPLAETKNAYTVNSAGSMGSIDPVTAPQSSGYATAESLSALQPVSPNSLNLNPPEQIMDNDFRSVDDIDEREYTRVTPADYQQLPPGSYNNVNVNNNMPQYGMPQAAVNGYSQFSIKPAKPQASNPILGLIGALLFSLIGAIVWVLIGKLGYVSYIGGLVLSLCCIKGYKIFGKRFDAFGFIISLVVVAAVVLGSNIFIEVWNIYSEPDYVEILEMLGFTDFFDTYFRFFDLMNTIDNLSGESSLMVFLKDLGLSYLFAGISFVVVGVSELKKN